MLDGHWAPDGQSLAVSDVAGQVHIYGLGGRDGLRWALLRAHTLLASMLSMRSATASS